METRGISAFVVMRNVSTFTMQYGCQGIYCIKMCNNAQNNITTEKEMFLMWLLLKHFGLCCCNIYVLTKHKNLTFDELMTQRVLHWHSIFKNILPWLHCIDSLLNILLDDLSWLHWLPYYLRSCKRRNSHNHLYWMIKARKKNSLGVWLPGLMMTLAACLSVISICKRYWI